MCNKTVVNSSENDNEKNLLTGENCVDKNFDNHTSQVLFVKNSSISQQCGNHEEMQDSPVENFVHDNYKPTEPRIKFGILQELLGNHGETKNKASEESALVESDMFEDAEKSNKRKFDRILNE